MRVSRRDFLKISGLSLASAAFRPYFNWPEERDLGLLARVATKQIDVRSKPNDQASIVGNRFRDQLIPIYDSLHPPDAPQFYNTLWYRVWGGYMHSARMQIVQVRLNDPVPWVPESGQLSEVTVPFTEAYQNRKGEGWVPWRGSRLYYSSVHWITGVEEGPDGTPWYQLISELTSTEVYYVPARHLRIIQPHEYAPIAEDVPAEEKRIEVSLMEQTLRAYEGDELALETRISSGIPNDRLSENDLPTGTPQGKFRIYAKLPSKHMGSVAGGPEVEENGGFSLPGVPWTCFFLNPGGYALHGTYWHNNFGLQMSHGCVNMQNEAARWLFRWTTPVFDPDKVESHQDWEVTGNGTRVTIF